MLLYLPLNREKVSHCLANRRGLQVTFIKWKPHLENLGSKAAGSFTSTFKLESTDPTVT